MNKIILAAALLGFSLPANAEENKEPHKDFSGYYLGIAGGLSVQNKYSDASVGGFFEVEALWRQQTGSFVYGVGLSVGGASAYRYDDFKAYLNPKVHVGFALTDHFLLSAEGGIVIGSHDQLRTSETKLGVDFQAGGSIEYVFYQKVALKLNLKLKSVNNDYTNEPATYLGVGVSYHF